MAVLTWPRIIKKHLKERRILRQVHELEKRSQELEKQLMEKEKASAVHSNFQTEATEQDTPDQFEHHS